ncbi:MAG: hypothetical protein AAGI24_12095 [Pseudomonadota bacterium]
MSASTPSPASTLLSKSLRLLIALVPWGLSMFLHYWLEYEEIWRVDMPFRAVISAGILTTGLCLSFLTHSVLASRLGSRH